MYVYDLFFNLAFFFFLLILPSSMFFTVIVFLVLSFWGEKEPFQFLNKNAHLFCNLKKKKEICVFKLELEYIYIYIYITGSSFTFLKNVLHLQLFHNIFKTN